MTLINVDQPATFSCAWPGRGRTTGCAWTRCATPEIVLLARTAASAATGILRNCASRTFGKLRADAAVRLLIVLSGRALPRHRAANRSPTIAALQPPNRAVRARWLRVGSSID